MGAGKLSEPSISKHFGRRNTTSGRSAPRQSCPSGSASVLARNQETQTLPTRMRMLVQRLPLLMTTQRKRKKKRRKREEENFKKSKPIDARKRKKRRRKKRKRKRNR